MFDRIREKMRRNRNTYMTIKALNALTDGELRDIGLTRGEITEIATNIISIHRTVRNTNEDNSE